ncbi:MAG: chromosome segregation protein SMC [Pseudomonadota bacterium]
MKFTNMRLVGFKSFVEATDFEIRDGLTGIVGPNGCGKSNLLEALRWVMGATSAKALRGGGMGDVIFSGTSMRPARNWAEVILTLDNSDRSAPAEYNETEVIEVSRRILHKEEGTQSIYRINNREVRAKDVQLLFADASTGANSPALVRQGQISELINAKPQNRRRLLEEAAGITGLHSRRHEAELRLRAAETNLERLEDVTGELETQKTALARQARQATRYRNISGDIRRAEAMAAYLRWSQAVEAAEEAESNLQDVSGLIEETTRASAVAASAQTQSHEALDPLRQAEAGAAAGLHRLTVARENLDEEGARAKAELERLSAEIDRLSSDRERETGLKSDAEEAISALAHEADGLEARAASDAERLAAAKAEMETAANALGEAERAFDAANSDAADIDARRRATSAAIDDCERRIEKIRTQTEQLNEERSAKTLTDEQARALAQAQARHVGAEEAARAAEAAFQRAEEEQAEASEAEKAASAPLRKAEQSFAEISAECEALKRVLATSASGDWPALIETVEVEPGYENALAAALGDDLGAALDEAAPAYWSSRAGAGQFVSDGDASSAGGPLPFGAAPLSRFVKAPPQLARRLSSIGVVSSEHGARLQNTLAPGVRLVSEAGDLWRWDGYVARAEAKTAAAIRLEQRNRLNALSEDLETAQERESTARRLHDAALDAVETRGVVAREARSLFTEARRTFDSARTTLDQMEREHERASSRIAAIDEALVRLRSDAEEVCAGLSEARATQGALPDAGAVAETLARAREAVASARTGASETRAAHNDLAREAEMRGKRLEDLARERGVWTTRLETAVARIGEVDARLSETKTSKEEAAAAPVVIEEKRSALFDKIAEAENRRNAAADALAQAVTQASEADKTARAAEAAAAEAREARARLEAQSESAVARVDDATRLARETCEAEPEDLLEIAEHKEGKDLPAREDIDRKLERYKRERENLGGVNLRAEEEMQEVSGRLEELVIEREDCEAAIRKLRSAIGGLNKEARQRLIDAFETVNANFSSLFTRLFNGGQAELRMIDSDDVLEAGLEIFASPPGKKLASMSLMSGGEQALTATALIFAVFMANPAPVCVLDEVDAPLDDANTERFCRMLHEMASETETRFIVITHHALTMSRMNRLFGVTMIERGVSQLVSVDLHRAEELAAAE